MPPRRLDHPTLPDKTPAGPQSTDGCRICGSHGFVAYEFGSFASNPYVMLRDGVEFEEFCAEYFHQHGKEHVTKPLLRRLHDLSFDVEVKKRRLTALPFNGSTHRFLAE